VNIARRCRARAGDQEPTATDSLEAAYSTLTTPGP